MRYSVFFWYRVGVSALPALAKKTSLTKRTNDWPILGRLRLACPFFDPNWRDSSYDMMEGLFACDPMSFLVFSGRVMYDQSQ
jgi:hypothetical protein